jgi:hypothetical protein
MVMNIDIRVFDDKNKYAIQQKNMIKMPLFFYY